VNAGFDALSGGLLIVALVLVVAEIGFNVFVAIDASKHPDWAFQQAGTMKPLWIGLPAGAAAISALCCLCGGILGAGFGVLLAAPGVVWMASFRGKVIDAEQRGGSGYGGSGAPPPGGYGGPPPGGYGGPPPGGPYGPPGGPPPGFTPPSGPPGGFPPPGAPPGSFPPSPPGGPFGQ